MGKLGYERGNGSVLFSFKSQTLKKNYYTVEKNYYTQFDYLGRIIKTTQRFRIFGLTASVYNLLDALVLLQS